MSRLRYLRRLIAALRRDDAGSMVTMFAVMAPLLVGAVGLGVESGQWYASKRSLQTAADAAAISGAFERAHGQPGQVDASALREAVRNGFVNTAPNTITINNPPTTGPNTGDQKSVEVILKRHPTLLLTQIVSNDLEITARSVAQVQVTGQACILSLDPHLSGGITNSGNPTLDLSGCVLAANSDDATAIDLTGSIDLTAESLFTAGNYSESGSATVNLAQTPTVHAFPIDDPYANLDLTIPPGSGCDHVNTSFHSNATINPGIYCGGITFGASSHVTLRPGTYYLDAGDFRANAGSTIDCLCNGTDGVTIVLTSTSTPSQIGTVTINGGANISLKAPSDPTSPLSGLLFYQDPRAPAGATDKFNGGANQTLTGVLYFPNQTVEYAGNNGSSGSTCTQIIANQVVFTGNATVVNSGCQAAGVQPLEITGVKVVE